MVGNREERHHADMVRLAIRAMRDDEITSRLMRGPPDPRDVSGKRFFFELTFEKDWRIAHSDAPIKASRS